MTTLETAPPVSSNFLTTRWTQVLSARGNSPQARIALGELCEAYWRPIFRFIRRSGYDEEAARDHTQEFVAQFLARNGVDAIERSRGRFRSYLLGAVKHFLSDQKDRASAAKRGGGVSPVSIPEPSDTSTNLDIPDPSSVVPDAFFDRQWALNIIERALRALAAEFAADGKSEHFEVLKPWLVGGTDAQAPGEAAVKLGLSEGAMKVAIHRFRKHFRAMVKAEIGETVSDPAEVQAELRYLVEVLSQN